MALFINIHLRKTIKSMSTSKSVDEGLMSQVCGRSPGRSKPSISYIPPMDAIQDTSSDHMMKVVLPKRVHVLLAVFTQGTF